MNSKVVVAVVIMLVLTSSCLCTNGNHQEHRQQLENKINEGKGRRFPDEQSPHRECNREDYKCWNYGLKVGNKN